MRFFEIFKAGNYPQGNFSIKDIETIVQNYDPTFCEAPITLDHEQKGPALGWIDKLWAENGILKASFRDLSPELKELVKSGKYKKVSVEIYRNLESRGPYLKSVSFLGAAAPQVKGMEPIEFKDGESEIYIFELKETEIKTSDELIKFKEQVSELENQLKLFTDRKETTEIVSMLQEKVKEISSQIVKMQDDSIARQKAEQELSKLRKEVKQSEFEQFLEKQLEAGNLTPTQKDISLKILMTLNNTANFKENDNSVQDFKELLKSLPKQVEFGEFATKDKQNSEAEFIEFAGADEDSLEIYKEAKVLSEKEKIPFKDALLKIYK